MDKEANMEVIYTIYGMIPGYGDVKLGLIKKEMREKEKRVRERDWKQMARKNYRKR